MRRIALALVALAAVEACLVELGRVYGSTRTERDQPLPGDDAISRPVVQTDHAVTIDVPPSEVWPWLVQMGWGRGGWYTARWVDRLLFPANGPSADRIRPDLQQMSVGDFVPDGPPESGCGFHVLRVEQGRSLVLRSTTHLPRSWRDRARMDWTWAFFLTPTDGAMRTRFHFRSRWVTHPWWLTLAGWLGVVPADFVMSRDMLRGIKRRAERAGTSAGGAVQTGWCPCSAPVDS